MVSRQKSNGRINIISRWNRDGVYRFLRPCKSKKRKREKSISVFKRFTKKEVKKESGSDSDRESDHSFNIDNNVELLTFEQFLGLTTTQRPKSQTAELPSKKPVMRSKVIEEIIETEKSYVKSLADIIEGFKTPFEANPNLSKEQINRIFGNIEELYSFQTSFLASLLACFNPVAETDPALAQVGAVFLNWAPRFEVYSFYCNNFCFAQHELGRFEKLVEFSDFSEACRVKRGLIRFKLADFLLVPIQRICKYKILLRDLVKNTTFDHEDYGKSEEALKAIEQITQKINDSKKKYEETINVDNFQLNIKKWVGSDLSARSFCQIHSGTLQRQIYRNQSVLVENEDSEEDVLMEDREVTLFDNQMVICFTNDENEKILEERIDLNHVTALFEEDVRRIKIECHFKKFSKVIVLTADEKDTFLEWRRKMMFELKFNDVNENKDIAYHILGDKCTRAKLRSNRGQRRSPRNSIGHIFETIRRKKPEIYKTL